MTSPLSLTFAGILVSLAAVLAADSDERPAGQGPEQLLARTIDRPVTASTLEDALGALERQARKDGRLLIIVDWAELGRVGVKRNARVTLTQEKATVLQYLELLLRSASPASHPLAWYRLETTVFVSTQEYVLAHKSRLGTPEGNPELVGPAASERPARPAPPAPASDRPARPFGMGALDQTPLEAVIERLREATDLSFHVNWKALEAIGVTRQSPVTLKIRRITADRALDLICEDLGDGTDRLKRVYWYIEDGIVFLSSGEALNNTPLSSVTQPLGILAMDVPDFIGPRIDVTRLGANQQQTSGSGGIFGTDSSKGSDEPAAENPDNKLLDRAARKKALKDNIVNVVKNSIGKDMWEPDGKGRVEIVGDKIIVSQTKLGWILLGRVAEKK